MSCCDGHLEFLINTKYLTFGWEPSKDHCSYKVYFQIIQWFQRIVLNIFSESYVNHFHMNAAILNFQSTWKMKTLEWTFQSIHDITEILLQVVLDPITHPIQWIHDHVGFNQASIFWNKLFYLSSHMAYMCVKSHSLMVTILDFRTKPKKN